MAFPTAAGVPSHSGILIPDTYDPKLLVEFYKSTIFGAISNTNYQNTFKKMGDEVKIRALPTISSREYVKGADLEYDRPEPTVQSFYIDKGRYWAFDVDDVDKAQSDMTFWSDWATHAAKNLAIEVDRLLLADIPGDAHAKNKGITAGAVNGGLDLGTTGNPRAVNSAAMIKTILDCGVALDEQNIGNEGRWIVLPAWAVSLLKLALKDASMTGDIKSPLRNGMVGTVDRFTVYMSNNLNKVAADSAWQCLFGTNDALTFAAQIEKTETVRAEKQFADRVRSMMVYGYKVIKPEAIGDLYLSIAAEA